MLIDGGCRKTWLIGDPHLGKRFEVGVPLHRRGEREAHQMALFVEELATPNVDMVVMVGDLFDHPYVGYAIVKETADAVLAAAHARPNVTFIMMAGNHDLPRNITQVGAFHAFDRMVSGRFPNLLVLFKPTIVSDVAFMPWEWGRTTKDQVNDFHRASVRKVIVHQDLKSFGKDDHLVPVTELVETFGDAIEIYGGHYHEPGVYRVEGRDVHCTGSLEPYSHGEDSAGSRYVTLSRDDLLAADPAEFRDKCVRVLLRPGEDVPEIDALAITHERVRGTGQDDGGGEQTSLSTLDWGGILAKKLAPLHPVVKAFIEERLSTNDTSDAEE